MTFDDETRQYTNLTGYFTLFGDRNIHICGANFYGYVQDVSREKGLTRRSIVCLFVRQVVLIADQRRENVIQNCIRNPSLIDYDPSVGWNNRAAIPERKIISLLICFLKLLLLCSTMRKIEIDLSFSH